MTIDERIEALTQSIELLASLHRDNETKYEARFSENETRIRESEARFDARFSRLMEITERLAHVAENHSDRIKGLEDNR